MLLHIALFEVRKRLRWISTYIYFGVFFLISFLAMIAAAGAFPGVNFALGSSGGAQVYANAPHAMAVSIPLLSYMGMLITSAIAGQAVNQDFENGTSALFFTAPITRTQYLAGRFLGALAVIVLIFSSIGLGMRLGAAMPFVNAERIGPTPLMAYVAPYLFSVIPNLVFTAALFFSLASMVRRMLPIYVASVLLLVGYLIATVLVSNIDQKTTAGVLDPLGMVALKLTTQYWTPAERNTLLVLPTGVYLTNRLLWLGVSLALLAFTFVRFRFAHHSGAEGGRATSRQEAAESSALPSELPQVKVQPRPGLALLPGMAWLQFRETVKNVYFVVIMLAGVLFMILAARVAGAAYGTPSYPLTYQLLELLGGSFGIFMVLVIIFYSGELVWRERDVKMDQLFDALPLPTWLSFVAKLLALFAVEAVMLAAVMATCLLVQIFRGYYHFELGLYARHLLGVEFLPLCYLCVLGLTIQSVVQNKYVGHALMTLYWMGSQFLGILGFEHHLYSFGSSPRAKYSDMNGYGHAIQGVIAFNVHWAFISVLFAVAARLLWARGVELDAKARLKAARRQFSWPLKALTGVAAAGALGMGGFIYYNTNVLNPLVPSDERERISAEYEKAYKGMEKEPTPQVTAAKLTVDLFPEQRRARFKGTLTLTNKTQQPVTRVLIGLLAEAKISALAVGAEATAEKEDRRHNALLYTLKQPLAPGATLPLTFDVEYAHPGFENESTGDDLVYNGTFMHSGYLPQVGYSASEELVADHIRKRYGLAPRPRLADVNDADARMHTAFGTLSNWIDLETVISTSPDQIAVVPGYLQREWTENGRRYFHYKTDGKMVDFYTFVSARYAVKRDKWNDVNLEIYYHPGHEYNLDRMMESMKASLDYYTTNFGPYQFRQLRILEFPRYRQFAQSFANTIPFSESMGFISKVDPNDPKDVDFPYYVTAHEIAHQWWGHQVLPAYVQGSAMLSETFAQYSALMVMKKRYGAEQMQRFLRYELDGYLMGRALDVKGEQPLARVEQQMHIYYQKGSLVMYALQDAIGEDKVNQALSRYRKQVAFQEPPFTATPEFLRYLREETPPEKQYILDDWFNTITLYENKAVAARAVDKGNGTYEVTVDVEAKQLRADEKGKETELAVKEPVDIGVLDEKGQVLLLQRQELQAPKASFTVTVKGKPATAGIDPLNKLIDRHPKDNLVTVQTL